MNKMDIGNINHSANVGRNLTSDSIFKNRIKSNLDSPLESIGKGRPVALIAEKITLNKLTSSRKSSKK